MEEESLDFKMFFEESQKPLFMSIAYGAYKKKTAALQQTSKKNLHPLDELSQTVYSGVQEGKADKQQQLPSFIPVEDKLQVVQCVPSSDTLEASAKEPDRHICDSSTSPPASMQKVSVPFSPALPASDLITNGESSALNSEDQCKITETQKASQNPLPPESCISVPEPVVPSLVVVGDVSGQQIGPHSSAVGIMRSHLTSTTRPIGRKLPAQGLTNGLLVELCAYIRQDLSGFAGQDARLILLRTLSNHFDIHTIDLESPVVLDLFEKKLLQPMFGCREGFKLMAARSRRSPRIQLKRQPVDPVTEFDAKVFVIPKPSKWETLTVKRNMPVSPSIGETAKQPNSSPNRRRGKPY